MYLYTGSQFVKLCDGGQIETIIPNTAGFYTGYENFCAPYFIENGALKRLEMWGDEPTETVTVIPEQVVECTGFNRLFVTLEDGNVYVFWGGKNSSDDPDLPDELVLLGNAGDAQYYYALWQDFNGSLDEFV